MSSVKSLRWVLPSVLSRRPPAGASADCRGFTLIEIILAMLIFSIMGLFTIQFISSSARTNQLAAEQKELIDQGKVATEFLTRELRLAMETNTQIQCGSPLQDCSTGTFNSITFEKKFPFIMDTHQSINYNWNTGSAKLTRTSTSQDGSVVDTTTLAGGVTNFAVTEQVAGYNFFTLSLTLQGAGGETYTLDSGIRYRNFWIYN